MKNNFALRYSSKFYDDLYNMISYIRDELKNPNVANKLLIDIENGIKDRLKNPLGYERYITKAGNIYYRIYIKNYIIFYTVKENTMLVRRLIYGKRNLEKLL